jgi:transcriptional regulator GlxA family with amidase domain
VIVGPSPAAGHGSEAGSAVAQWHVRLVRSAIAVMEADPSATFRVADLARMANVSVRTLQARFRQHTGTSPMGYLRQVRLERAHEDLLATDPPHATVARIAHRFGFSHLGRFAAAYRARYGLSPSTTLRAEPVPPQCEEVAGSHPATWRSS